MLNFTWLVAHARYWTRILSVLFYAFLDTAILEPPAEIQTLCIFKAFLSGREGYIYTHLFWFEFDINVFKQQTKTNPLYLSTVLTGVCLLLTLRYE